MIPRRKWASLPSNPPLSHCHSARVVPHSSRTNSDKDRKSVTYACTHAITGKFLLAARHKSYSVLKRSTGPPVYSSLRGMFRRNAFRWPGRQRDLLGAAGEEPRAARSSLAPRQQARGQVLWIHLADGVGGWRAVGRSTRWTSMVAPSVTRTGDQRRGAMLPMLLAASSSSHPEQPVAAAGVKNKKALLLAFRTAGSGSSSGGAAPTPAAMARQARTVAVAGPRMTAPTPATC